MFDIAKSTDVSMPSITKIDNLDFNQFDLVIACDINKVLFQGKVSNLSYTNVPFYSKPNKIREIAQYGLGVYNILLPFHLNHINSYRTVYPIEMDKSVQYGYSKKKTHEIIFDLASPYYPDYMESLNSRPFVNHYNELTVNNV